jgi:hypothetical protein
MITAKQSTANSDHSPDEAQGREPEESVASGGPRLEVVRSPPPEPTPAKRINGILIGYLVAAGKEVRVSFPGCHLAEGMAARAIVPLETRDLGAEVALSFELGDPGRPLVLGKIALPSGTKPGPRAARPDTEQGDERIVLRAEKEIVLTCGEASITLTRAGKVLIRGAYVLNASTGAYRIIGGCIEIN